MSITVTPNTDSTPPSNTVEVSLPTGSVMTEVRVWRNDATGAEDLRTQPSAGFDSREVDDVECPHGVATTYEWSASYVTPAEDVFEEEWSSLDDWTTSGASWSTDSGTVVWSASDSLTASVSREVTSGRYRITFDALPTGLSKIDFGGFYIDVNNSRLYIGASSVLFAPGTTTWRIEVTESAVTISTSVGTYSLAGEAVVTGVEFLGAVRGAAFTRKFGASGTGNGQFTNVWDVATDASGNIFVASDNRIQKFDSSGVYQSQFGSSGSGDGQFGSPHGIAVDQDTGDIYVADYENNRIQKFDSSGTFVWKSGTAGSGDGEFNQPRGVALDSSGNVFVTDSGNSRIQKLNTSGVYQSKFGSSGSSDGQFAKPHGIVIDASDNIYVAETNNSRVQKFNSSGTFQSKFGSSGSGDGKLTWPTGITLDSAGNIFVADYAASSTRIQKFNSSGTFVALVAGPGSSDGQVSVPWGLTTDASDNLVVADRGNNRAQVFSSSATLIPGITVTEYGDLAAITETSDPVTLSPESGWLIHPGTPALSFPLQLSSGANPRVASIRSIDGVSNPANATIHRILGTGTGIAVVNGPRDDDETAMTISIHTRDEELALKALLQDQTAILVNIDPAKGVDFAYGFYQVGDTSSTRLGQAPNMPFRSYTLPMVKVSSPIVTVQSTGWSWAALAAEFPTWDAVKAAFATWADVASNTRI